MFWIKYTQFPTERNDSRNVNSKIKEINKILSDVNLEGKEKNEEYIEIKKYNLLTIYTLLQSLKHSHKHLKL